MRTTNIGGKEIQLRANPLALLFYSQEFGRDLIADLIGFQKLQGALAQGDFSGLDTVALFRIAWAMAKAADHKNAFPSFKDWLSELEVDFTDVRWLVDVVEEAAQGFFRAGASAQEAKR